MVAVAVLSAAGAAMAGSVAGTGGSTEITQIANNLQLVQQYEQQVMGYVQQGLQLQADIDNLIRNPFSLLGKDIGGVINQVGSIMSGANSIAGGVAQVDRNFATKFKYTPAKNMASNFTSWHDTSTASLDKVLKGVDLHRADYASDTARIAAVVQASANNKGPTAGLDTLRDINLLQIEHTRKLGELLATQHEAQATYLAGQVARDEAKSGRNATIMGSGNLPLSSSSIGGL